MSTPMGAPHPDDPPVTSWPRLGVHKLADGAGYMVPSAKSAPGAYWFVWGATCTCPAGEHARKADRPSACRHVRLTGQAENMGHAARPMAPVNASALVD